MCREGAWGFEFTQAAEAAVFMAFVRARVDVGLEKLEGAERSIAVERS